MADGQIGHGAKLEAYPNTSEYTQTNNMTSIGVIASISGPSFGGDSIELTNMDSGSGYKGYIQGLKDGGEITVNLNYDGTLNQTAKNVEGMKASGTLAWKIKADPITTTTTNFAYWTAQGFITGINYDIPVDDKMTEELTIKLTGPVAFTDET